MERDWGIASARRNRGKIALGGVAVGVDFDFTFAFEVNGKP